MSETHITALRTHVVSRPSRSTSSPNRDDGSDHSDMDDDELFAQLEAEIENSSDAHLRDGGLERLKQELVYDYTSVCQFDNVSPGWPHSRTWRIVDMVSMTRFLMRKRWFGWARKSLFFSSHILSDNYHSGRREKYCVIHFYHTKFKRCQIMDNHLSVCMMCSTLYLSNQNIDHRAALLQNALYSSICRECPVVSRKARNQSPPMRHMFHRRRFEGTVSFQINY